MKRNTSISTLTPASTSTSTSTAPRAPHGLGTPGKALWHWAAEHYEITGVEPLLFRLCSLQDRLAGVAAELAKADKSDPRLISCEVKLTTQFISAWKSLGMADAPEERRGWPAGVPNPKRKAG